MRHSTKKKAMMHVSKMIVVRREYRGQPLMVLVRNGRPWFDLKAVCQSIGVKDIEHEAELLGDGHVTCVDTYDEDGSVNRIIKCSVEGLDVILDRRQASAYKAWVIDVVMPAVHHAIRTVIRKHPEAAALPPVAEGVDWLIDALDAGHAEPAVTLGCLA